MTHVREVLSWLVLSSLAAAPALAEAKLFFPSDPETRQRFGSAIGAEDGIALIGIPNEGSPEHSGRIEIFERDGLGDWSSAGIFVSPAPAPSVFFGGRFVYDGVNLFVGANTVNQSEGAVYWRQRDETLPQLFGAPVTLFAPDSNIGDRFGFALAAQGSVLAVSSIDAHIPDTEIRCGAVYLFEVTEDDVLHDQRLQPVDDCPPLLGSHAFGSALAVDGARLAATLEPTVQIYDKVAGDWTRTATLDPGPDGHGNNNLFGRQLALEGERLLVSSPGNRQAYIYEKVSGVWTKVADLGTSDAVPPVVFGSRAVALSGDLALVGCHSCPQGMPDAPGAVYVYQRQSDGSWPLVRRFLGPPDGEFGSAIDFDGQRAWVGAPGATVLPIADTGAAYLIDVAPAVFADGFESGDLVSWTLVVDRP